MFFIHDVGVPGDLATDGAKEETLGEWEETLKKFCVRQHVTEPHLQWQSRAEYDIGEIKQLMPKHRMI